MTLNLHKLLFLLSLGLIFSCETVVDLDIDEEPELVIHSLFTPGDLNNPNNHFDVRVLETKSILDDNELEHVELAEVIINPIDDDVDELVSLLAIELPNFRRYRTNAGPKEGVTYELNVFKEGYNPVIATSFVPHGVNIENLKFEDIEILPHQILPGELEYTFNLQFEIQDDIEEENYYHLVIFRVIGRPTPNSEEGRVTIAFDERTSVNDPSVEIVNNNRVFFGAHISDETFNGQKKKFDLNMIFRKLDIPWDNDVMVEAQLRTVSKDYYRYQIEGARFTNNGTNTFFNDQTTISNNIENGFGLFAGYSIRIARAELTE